MPPGFTAGKSVIAILYFPVVKFLSAPWNPWLRVRVPSQSAMGEHRTMESFVGRLVAAVPSRKQPPRSIQKLYGPSFRCLVRMFFAQEPDVAYQMCPTVQGLDPIVPSEGAVG